MSSGDENAKVTTLPKLLSTEDLAEILDLDPETVRKRRQRGASLPPGQVVAGRFIYCRRDVERWLHAQTARSSA